MPFPLLLLLVDPLHCEISARGPPNANYANYGATPLVIPVGR